VAGPNLYLPQNIGAQGLFSLYGNNVVRNLSLSQADSIDQTFSLTWIHDNNVTVTKNAFSSCYNGVLIDNYDYQNTVLTLNDFACGTSGVGFNSVLVDSVIDGNRFWPGSWYSAAVGGGAGMRLDISSNSFPTTNPYNYPTFGPSVGIGMELAGSSPSENVLIAQNDMPCVGLGAQNGQTQGNAIILDGSGGTPVPFYSVRPVVAASPTQVSITSPPSETNPAFPSTYPYIGQWLRIVYGTGLGQSRKITQATVSGDTFTFTVDPAFDVTPDTSSNVSLLAQYVQANIVDNISDASCSLVSPFPWNSQAGNIAMGGATSDCAVEGNQLTHTGGILATNHFDDLRRDDGSFIETAQTSQYFLEIRSNKIDGANNVADNVPIGFDVTYYSSTNANGGGIVLWDYGIVDSKTGETLNPYFVRPGFGCSVSHNSVTNTANTGFDEGKIVQVISVGEGISTNSTPPPVPQTPNYLDTLIFGNYLLPPPVVTTLDWQIEGVSIGGSVNTLNDPVGTAVCGNHFDTANDLSYMPSPSPVYDYSGVSFTCTSGCVDVNNKPVQPDDYFAPGMVGCGGSVMFSQKQQLCSAGYHPCTADEWNAYRGSEPLAGWTTVPTSNYWTATALQGSGTSNACSAVTSGNWCDLASYGMGVCTPNNNGTDAHNNTCPTHNCGYNTTTDQHFGCLQTAGTLCCAG
jgi:hypothetical protein